jgi:hypothetical protein
MAIKGAGHATTRSERYALGPGADLPIARIVAVLLIVLAVGAVFFARNVATAGPSEAAREIGSFNPKSLFADNTPHFLPTPVAAVPPDSNAGPPPPAPDEQPPPATSIEQVKIANTGRAGAILRASPPRGPQVATLRDGTVLDVIERQQLSDGSEWLHVRTPDGQEGWVFSSLVAPAD